MKSELKAKNKDYLTCRQWSDREGLKYHQVRDLCRRGKLKDKVRKVEFIIELVGIPKDLDFKGL